MLTRRALLGCLSAAALLPKALRATPPSRGMVLIGTSTRQHSGSKGIYVADWSPAGELRNITLAAELASPTFLSLDSNAGHLYAVSEVAEGRVTAFRVSSHGQHTVVLNNLGDRTTQGNGPAYVCTSLDGLSVVVCNYGSGSVTSYKVQPSGALSDPVSHFQYTPVDTLTTHRHPHAHEGTPSPDGRWLLVNDLGSDRIGIYELRSATGVLVPAEAAFWQARLGSGPRHLVFHPNGSWVYNANELDCTVDHLIWNASAGTLRTQGTYVSTFPPGQPVGTSSLSEIIISSDGRFVYVGIVGNESISKFDVEAASGNLTLSQVAAHGGEGVRHLALDPTESFLLAACEDSGEIVVLGRDPTTGRLSAPLHRYKIGSPQCLVFTA